MRSMISRPRRAARTTRAALAACALSSAGCHAFVLREERVTPDPAPVTRLDVVGAETTYVLRTAGYALLSRDRRLLWTRTTLDGARQRFHWLFGVMPPLVAIRVDSAPAPLAAAPTEWEGLPLLTVSLSARAPRRIEPGEDPAVEVPEVAARAARAWVATRHIGTDAWWLEAAAVRIVGDASVRVSAIAQTTAGRAVPLATLFTMPRPTQEQAASPSPSHRGGARAAARTNVWASAWPTALPEPDESRAKFSLAAQAASVLLYLRDRDSTFVAELPARLQAGRTMPELLAASATLPHTVDALDAAWKKWLRSRPSRSVRG
jgi:hypothetical protein